MKSRLITAVALAAGLPACSGLQSLGTVGQHTVRVDGTGFAWLDLTTYVTDGVTIDLQDRSSDESVLHMRFSQAVFEPAIDFRTLTAAERQDVNDALANQDLVTIDVRRGDELRPDDLINYDNEDNGLPPETLPYVDGLKVHLTEAPLGKGSTYPTSVTRMASGLTAQLKLNETSPRLKGRLDVQVRKGKDENREGTALATGAFSVLFDVELLSERLAECNFDPAGAGSGDPCGELDFAP